MTPYWIFLNLLTICVVSTMSMKKDSTRTRARKLDRIIEDLTEQECSGLTQILEAVNERLAEESENCSPNTETIIQTAKPECPTSLSPQPTACLQSTKAAGDPNGKDSQRTICRATTVIIEQTKTVKVTQECPTISLQPTTCLQSTTMTPSCESCQPTPGTTASGKESSKGNRSSIIVLGLFTGILFATLVVVIVGWIVTCVVLKVKLTQRDQQKRTHTEPHQAVLQPTSNMYNQLNHGQSDTTPPAMKYNSLGPDRGKTIVAASYEIPLTSKSEKH